MSVLNQSGEEQVECPLCMEPLEVDDLNFYPCTCGYQICRFCWHRIRTDENGLCPACRKAYSENPADFTPLSKEQVAQLKAEKRQRDQQRKAKLSESRKHLASVRVVQRNLVFVVGLPLRLADAEILKRHEYFGKFGKIHKVVINQSTTYAGSQGPSASAYVTYMKSDDALRAIQSVNNIILEGRQIKSSLGTTKYCSHFMKNQPCPKPDCMYLHDFGDPEASFTKEQMHAGKHQEYEKKLHEALQSKMAAQARQEQLLQQQQGEKVQQTAKTKDLVTNCSNGSSGSNNNGMGSAATTNGKESWPQLNSEKKLLDEKKIEKPDATKEVKNQKSRSKVKNGNNNIVSVNNNVTIESKKVIEKKNSENTSQSNTSYCMSGSPKIGNDRSSEESPSYPSSPQSNGSQRETNVLDVKDFESSDSVLSKLTLLEHSSSFFSQSSYQKLIPEQSHETVDIEGSIVLNDSLPEIHSGEDWEAAFGFGPKHTKKMEDHMGRDISQQRSSKSMDQYFFGMSLAQAENIGGLSQDGYDFKKDSLLGKLNKSNSYSQNSMFVSQLDERLGGGNGQVNGISNMSKFFTDFNSKDSQKDLNPLNNDYFQTHNPQNGLNGMNGYTQQPSLMNQLSEKQIMLLQQKHIQEQLAALNIKQQHQQQSLNQQHSLAQQQSYVHNPYVNGEMLQGPNGQRYNAFQNQFIRSNSLPLGKQNIRSEDDLDFDPFQETQKGLAELIESDQTLKLHIAAGNNGHTNQINGLLQHNQTGNGMLPPPPPGFVQPNHMNSFGSKILPYLNMNSQQMNQPPSNWPSGGYNNVLHQPQQQPQHKGMSACNDWKVLDPAIVSSSSRYFSLTAPIRDQYNSHPLGQIGAPTQLQQQPQQQQHQQQNGPMRSTYDFANTNVSYPNLSQLPPQGYSFAQLNTAAAQHWIGSELASQISSPPGFRSNGQATKQQEC